MGTNSKDIDGEAVDDNSGISVSLSSDGMTVAIGAFIMMVMEKIQVIRVYQYMVMNGNK